MMIEPSTIVFRCACALCLVVCGLVWGGCENTFVSNRWIAEDTGVVSTGGTDAATTDTSTTTTDTTTTTTDTSTGTTDTTTTTDGATDTNESTCDLNSCQADQICDSATDMCITCAADMFEENNSSDMATAISEGTTDGLTLCVGDEDHFSFTVPDNNGQASSVFIAVNFTNTNPRDIDIELFDSMGNRLAQAAGGTDNEFLVFFTDEAGGNQKLAAGTYTLRVYLAASSSQANSYSINLDFNPEAALCLNESNCATGQLCTSFQCSSVACTNNTECGGNSMTTGLDGQQVCSNSVCVGCTHDTFDQTAANDSVDTATSLEGNLTPDLDLNTCQGSDFYSFSAALNQTITARATYDTTNGSIDVLLRSPTGVRFAGVTGVDNGMGTDTATAQITASTEAGTWTLQVNGAEPSSVVNDYRLSITIQ